MLLKVQRLMGQSLPPSACESPVRPWFKTFFSRKEYWPGLRLLVIARRQLPRRADLTSDTFSPSPSDLGPLHSCWSPTLGQSLLLALQLPLRPPERWQSCQEGPAALFASPLCPASGSLQGSWPCPKRLSKQLRKTPYHTSLVYKHPRPPSITSPGLCGK